MLRHFEHKNILQQNETIGESTKVNNGNFSSIKESLNRKSTTDQSMTYAEAMKEAIKHVTKETPKSSRSARTFPPTSARTPVLVGTSSKVIGKPISPMQLKQNGRPRPALELEKAIWVSGIHRDTTEEELATYIKESIRITNVEVRKLVK